ncbi:hypothetical protein N7490_008062 [Penicillium lividum]|nr:hypothetical protein N7490_008062 [Penicillium lividum]
MAHDLGERGLKLGDLLQGIQLPVLGDSVIVELIQKCWHNQFATLAHLAVDTKELLLNNHNNKDRYNNAVKVKMAEGIASKKVNCQKWERYGRSNFLSSDHWEINE